MTHFHLDNPPSTESIRVLTVGDCPHRSDVLAASSLDARHFKTPDELVAKARDARARACLVCPEAFDDIDSIDDFVRKLRRQAPFLDIVAWLPTAEAHTVRDMMVHGIRDVVLDDDPEVLVRRIERTVNEQRYLPRLLEHQESLAERWEFEGMYSRSQRMREVFEICVRTAATDATVLILGETGTGKELLARAFHRRSERSGRMVSINCAAVPENLIDSELFGYVPGAFTGAEDGAEGLFRAADGGTLFLDEVGSIPLQVQYRLLRVLQEGRVRPVGSDREVEVDVRVIAATSVRLDEAAAAATFRDDLLYRLDVIRVVIPPLRDRPEDILFLFGHFMRQLSDHHGLRRPELEDSFLDALQSYQWPGNVRQLENLTERLLLTHHGRESLTADQFASLIAPAHDGEAEIDNLTEAVPDLDRDLPDVVQAAVDRTEEAYLRAALERTRGRVVRTAELAGISRRTLLRKLRRLDIDRAAYRHGIEAD